MRLIATLLYFVAFIAAKPLSAKGRIATTASTLVFLLSFCPAKPLSAKGRIATLVLDMDGAFVCLLNHYLRKGGLRRIKYNKIPFHEFLLNHYLRKGGLRRLKKCGSLLLLLVVNHYLGKGGLRPPKALSGCCSRWPAKPLSAKGRIATDRMIACRVTSPSC